jgi:hypothetical protein
MEIIYSAQNSIQDCNRNGKCNGLFLSINGVGFYITTNPVVIT